ncbi:MAG: hypothetical protein JWR26_261 [Pedosphaera sp.]|nr:hypothetical protein [Pedosphaera sp.]
MNPKHIFKMTTQFFVLLLMGCALGIEIPAMGQTNALLKGHGRKALVFGGGGPSRPGSGPSHPQAAKNNFLALMKNPDNNPKKGWTCDLSYDLMKSLGMDPSKTTLPALCDYLGKHDLGYRIFMIAGAGTGLFPGDLLTTNGMMPFCAHANNIPGYRLEDRTGIGGFMAVGGGTGANFYSYGPSLEFYDALPSWMSAGHYEDAAESWANQALAARFARILDAHPKYNIWDAREHMRQAASRFAEGWTEKNGFGRVDEKASVATLLPGAPVDFRMQPSKDGTSVAFAWQNFLQSDFAATVIAKEDGTVLYDGTGTTFTWTSDIEGDANFKFWSRNKAGVTSRLESFNTKTVHGLHKPTAQ